MLKVTEPELRHVCKTNMCNGCMACVEICKKNAIHIEDSLTAYNAVIDIERCSNCNLCVNVCPRNKKVDTLFPVEWKQGWVIDSKERNKSSSGGYATAISKAFIKDGGYVYSCVFEDGEFVFSKAVEVKECEKFRGSKYIKSNPRGIYSKIKKDLSEDKKVLFLGLPCQVAGLKNYLGPKYQDNLYTVDLICHGTPSPQLLYKYLQESHKINLIDIDQVDFRKKDNYNLRINGIKILPKRVRDKYTIAFMDSLAFTENCYFCEYAKVERVSDISLGDSWGSTIHEEEKKGISLALCQTDKGKYLLNIADIIMLDVDAEIAIQCNRQLQNPSKKPEQRKDFFIRIKRQKTFGYSVLRAFPKICIKEDIKTLLIKLKIMNDATNN